MNLFARINSRHIIFILFFAAFICNAQAKVVTQVIKVSVDGKRSSSQCEQHELPNCLNGLTLERAFEWLSGPEIKRMGRGSKVNVTINLSSGVYRLTAALNTNWGSADYHGALLLTGPNEVVAKISGAQIVNEFSLAKGSQLKKLPDGVKANVYAASLGSLAKGVGKELAKETWKGPVKRGFGRPITPVTLEMFFRGLPMQVARWPNNGFARIILCSTKSTQGDRCFRIEGRDLSRLAGESNLVATAYFSRYWAEESIPIVKINTERHELLLQQPGAAFGIKPGMPIHLDNALSELDHAGEWYLDRSTDMLYFWPPQPIKPGDVEVSILDTLLNIEGATNVRIANLQFEKSRGDAITIKNSENVVLAHSLIGYTGNHGVVISGGKNSGLQDVTIENTGEGGVVLEGGDRNILKPANLYVDNCKITRFSRLSSTYRPAVALEGVGNRVVHSIISDAPHNAIIFHGNDHLIAFNNISNVVQDTDDSGAIYTGRDWAARGTVIEGNFLHDIGGKKVGKTGVMGVYLDDQSSGVIVRGNVFTRVTNPIIIGGGRDNLVEQNLIFHSSPALHLDARGLKWQRAETIDPSKPWLKRLNSVPYNRPPYSNRYPHLADIRNDDLGAPKYNIVRHNLMIGSKGFDIKKEAESGITLENNFWDRDAKFLKSLSPGQRLQPDDFRLDPSSPALMNGFVMPSLNKMAH